MKNKLLLILFVTLFTLTGCRNGNDSLKKINVYNWGDYIDETVLEDFEKETGIKVIYETFGNNEELLSKIESGSTEYDVLFPSDYMVDIMAKKGLLQELDFNNIPNYDKIDKRLKGLNYDKDEKYSVPYVWQTVGICYNTEEVDEEEVKSWNALWNKKYDGDIIMLDSPRDSIGISLIRLGYSLNSTNDKELKKAEEELIKQKKIVHSYQIDYYKAALIGEEAKLSLAWSGDAFFIADENPKFSYSIPEEGTNVSIDCMVIPTQAKHKKEAEEFINFMNRPDIAKRNAEYIMYSSPNLEAIEMLDDEIKNDKRLYPDGDIESIGEIFTDLGDYNQKYDKIWTNVKATNVKMK